MGKGLQGRAHHQGDGHALLCPSYEGFIFNCAFLLTCEIQVPVLQPKDAANRFPDLVVLRPEHLALTQRRLTITLDMPPPRLIAEIVSSGKTNRDRDYRHKRSQYAAVGVPEYWLIDPGAQQVVVLTLNNGIYGEVGVFGPGSTLISVEFPDLLLRADQLLDAED